MNKQPTEAFPESFWDYNLPLQINDFVDDDDDEDMDDEELSKNKKKHAFLNYMARRNSCTTITEYMTKEELKIFCQNTASILRNLAELFELYGEDKISHIYYPDKDIQVALAEKEVP